MKNADMSAIPAYHEGVAVTLGLTKREMFAAMAMQGMRATEWAKDTPDEQLAQWSVDQADSLLAALEPKS